MHKWLWDALFGLFLVVFSIGLRCGGYTDMYAAEITIDNSRGAYVLTWSDMIVENRTEVMR